MRLIRNLTFACLFGSVALGACMTDSQPSEEMPVGSNSQSASYIKSATDLEIHLQTATNSPLDRLSSAAKQRFISSLVFTKYGLASYDHSDLNALSSTDAAQILALFKVSPRTILDDTVCKPLQGGCVSQLNFTCDTATCHGG